MNTEQEPIFQIGGVWHRFGWSGDVPDYGHLRQTRCGMTIEDRHQQKTRADLSSEDRKCAGCFCDEGRGDPGLKSLPALPDGVDLKAELLKTHWPLNGAGN